MKTDNRYQVPKELWSSLRTEGAKRLYNDVMDQALRNQTLTIHPHTSRLPRVEWETICHNMAYFAARAQSKQKIEKGDTIVELDASNKEVGRRRFN